MAGHDLDLGVEDDADLGVEPDVSPQPGPAPVAVDENALEAQRQANISRLKRATGRLDEPGKLETIARAGKDAASLGFNGEMEGAKAVTGEVLYNFIKQGKIPSDLKTLRQVYETVRDNEDNNNDLARTVNPVAHGVTSGLTAVVPALATGGESLLARAGSGAALGGLSALGHAKGSAADQAQQTLEGTVGGGIAGASPLAGLVMSAPGAFSDDPATQAEALTGLGIAGAAGLKSARAGKTEAGARAEFNRAMSDAQQGPRRDLELFANRRKGIDSQEEASNTSVRGQLEEKINDRLVKLQDKLKTLETRAQNLDGEALAASNAERNRVVQELRDTLAAKQTALRTAVGASQRELGVKRQGMSREEGLAQIDNEAADNKLAMRLRKENDASKKNASGYQDALKTLTEEKKLRAAAEDRGQADLDAAEKRAQSAEQAATDRENSVNAEAARAHQTVAQRAATTRDLEGQGRVSRAGVSPEAQDVENFVDQSLIDNHNDAILKNDPRRIRALGAEEVAQLKEAAKGSREAAEALKAKGVDVPALMEQLKAERAAKAARVAPTAEELASLRAKYPEGPEPKDVQGEVKKQQLDRDRAIMEKYGPKTKYLDEQQKGERLAEELPQIGAEAGLTAGGAIQKDPWLQSALRNESALRSEVSGLQSNLGDENFISDQVKQRLVKAMEKNRAAKATNETERTQADRGLKRTEAQAGDEDYLQAVTARKMGAKKAQYDKQRSELDIKSRHAQEDMDPARILQKGEDQLGAAPASIRDAFSAVKGGKLGAAKALISALTTRVGAMKPEARAAYYKRVMDRVAGDSARYGAISRGLSAQLAGKDAQSGLAHLFALADKNPTIAALLADEAKKDQ